MHQTRTFWLAALLALLAFAQPLWADTAVPAPIAVGSYKPLAPTQEESKISLEVVNQLQQHHYQKVKLDNAFSKKLLKAYLDDLDGSHSVFLASDVHQFDNQYQDQLDNDLKSGNLKPAFAIYNLYQKRRIHLMEMLLAELHQGVGKLDLSSDQTLNLDREHAPWPDNLKAQGTLWTQRLENEVINMRLDGDKPDKIQSVLTKRYESQLQRIRQAEPTDAFMAYMDAYTHSYDPHTDYFPPRESQNFDIRMKLSLEGIGAVLRSHDEYTEIVRLVPGGPAAKSGQLQPADRIVAVGQGPKGKLTDVVGMRLDEVVQLIRGPAGSTVRLQITPPNSKQSKVVTLVRQKVKLEDQAASKHVIDIDRNGKHYKIGVITLPTFYVDFQALQAGNPDYRSAARDVHKLLDELNSEHVDGVIMDLRNNGGGALQEAVRLVGLFIRSGPVVQIRDAGNRINVLGDRNPSVAYSGPLAVLVNRLSASASEIFTGAIQDYGRGLVLGSRTFGKGTVQTLIPLSQGQLKLTEAKFYRVSGESTQDRGVLPGITYPSIIAPDKIGESALANALPWDKIAATRYPHSKRIAKRVPKLKAEHQARIAHEPAYQYLVKRIRLARQQSQQSSVSLNLAQRRRERQHEEQVRLSLANRYRKAEGKPVFNSYAALQKSDVSKTPAGELMAHTAKPTAENDPYLHESAQVLVDLVRLEQGRGASTTVSADVQSAPTQ